MRRRAMQVARRDRQHLQHTRSMKHPPAAPRGIGLARCLVRRAPRTHPFCMALPARQQLILAEAVAEIDAPYPGRGDAGARWDGLALTIRNRLASRHRAALATGMEEPGPILSQEQVLQTMTQLVEKGLLAVARGADYTRRVSVTAAGRAALPGE